MLLSKVTIFPPKNIFFAKNADISKIKKALVLIDIFSGFPYPCEFVPNLYHVPNFKFLA